MRQSDVISIETIEIIGVWDVAGADATFLVVDDNIDSKIIVLEHFALNGQHVKFFLLTGGFANGPTDECVQFDVSFLTNPMDAGNIESLGQCHHGHGGGHPQIKGGCTARFLGIYLFHIGF